MLEGSAEQLTLILQTCLISRYMGINNMRKARIRRPRPQSWPNASVIVIYQSLYSLLAAKCHNLLLFFSLANIAQLYWQDR